MRLEKVIYKILSILNRIKTHNTESNNLNHREPLKPSANNIPEIGLA